MDVLPLVSVVCCKVGISATGRSLVPRSPTKCGVSECDLGTSKIRMPRPARAVEPWKEKILNSVGFFENSGDECSSLIRNIGAYVKDYTAEDGNIN